MKGISPIIGLALTILLVTSTTILIVTVIKPTFDKAKAYSIFNEGIQNLELLNSAIKEVASEAEGSKRTISITVSDGEYKINSAYDWLYFEYDPPADLGLSGRRGDIWIEKGLEFADWFNGYAENSLPYNLYNLSGSWKVVNERLEGEKGLAFFNLNKKFPGFSFSAHLENYNGQGEVFVTPVNPQNLTLFLPFDEGSGSIAYDFSGNKNNGTYYGYNPHTQSNSTLLYLTGSSPINLTHYFNLPSKAILSDVNLSVSYKNNTINGENVKVYVNGNYIGSFNSASGTSYTFVNILKSNFTAGALNNITYEGNVTNITQSTLRYLQDIGWIDGKYGKALSFDGVDDYVEVPDSPSLNPTSITITLWVYQISRNPNDWTFLLSKNGWGSYHIISEDKWASNQVGFTVRVGGIDYRLWTTSAIGPYWSFLAFTYDATTGKQKVYFNGKLENEASRTPGNIDTNAGPLRITGAKSYFFNGIVDEVRIYNRALSEEEIKAEYEAGLKKLTSSGTQTISSTFSPYLVLSNPSGKTYFDSIRINSNSKKLNLVIPFSRIDLNGTFRVSRGTHDIIIENKGFNSTSNKPIIQITAS